MQCCLKKWPRSSPPKATRHGTIQRRAARFCSASMSLQCPRPHLHARWNVFGAKLVTLTFLQASLLLLSYCRRVLSFVINIYLISRIFMTGRKVCTQSSSEALLILTNVSYVTRCFKSQSVPMCFYLCKCVPKCPSCTGLPQYYATDCVSLHIHPKGTMGRIEHIETVF